MFKFSIKYLGFLKLIPFMPELLDALLMIWTTAVNPNIIDAIDNVEVEISTWEGIHLSNHKFGGLQFNYGKKEIGHIHSNGILDILFSRKLKMILSNEVRQVNTMSSINRVGLAIIFGRHTILNQRLSF